MRKIIKLLNSRDEDNIKIAYILIKKKFKYLWIFNTICWFYRPRFYLWIGHSGILYIEYNSWGMNGNNWEGINNYK